MNRQARSWLPTVLLFLGFLLVISMVLKQASRNTDFTEQDFEQALSQKQVIEVHIQPNRGYNRKGYCENKGWKG